MPANTRLTKSMSPQTPQETSQMKNVPYANALRCILYVSTSTHLDISIATSHVAQYMSNPGPLHWVTVKRILCYLKRTQHFGLTYFGLTLDGML